MVTLILIAICMVVYRSFERKLNRDTLRQNALNAREVVSIILGQCNHPNRQRWVNDRMIEFVCVVLSSETPKRNLIWVRMRIEDSTGSAIVECAHTMPVVLMPFAEAIAEEFQNRHISSSLVRSFGQPSREEFGITKKSTARQ